VRHIFKVPKPKIVSKRFTDLWGCSRAVVQAVMGAAATAEYRTVPNQAGSWYFLDIYHAQHDGKLPGTLHLG
jgi:hypothetical protein